VDNLGEELGDAQLVQVAAEVAAEVAAFRIPVCHLFVKTMMAIMCPFGSGIGDLTLELSFLYERMIKLLPLLTILKTSQNLSEKESLVDHHSWISRDST
jgi:hypothetical protein